MTEVYQSSTHGDIPLSFTGRRLLANLRDAIHFALETIDYSADDNAVSKARGELAKYMSKLEDKQPIVGVDYSTREQADAWRKVYEALLAHNPRMVGMTGLSSALNEIKRLQSIETTLRAAFDAGLLK